MTASLPHLALLALVCIASTAHAQLQEWAYALTDDLSVVPIRFDHIDSTTGILGTDQLHLDRQFNPDSLLAVWFDQSSATMLPQDSTYTKSTLVELTDGQRLRLIIEEPNSPDTLDATRYDGGDRVSIPIERIHSITRSTQKIPLRSTDDDTILLTNNDQLTGYITTIGPVVQIETDTGFVTISLDQIAHMVVQNPRVHTPGIYVHTTLDERLRVSWFAASKDRELSITLDDPIYTQSTHPKSTINARLIAAEFKRNDLYLTNPTISPPISTIPTGGRQWAQKHTTKHSPWAGTERTTIFIPSPTAIRWAIPKNAQRFSAWISTMNDPWTDNQTSIIAITTDGTEHTLWSQRMTAASPRHNLLLDLPPQSTAIEIQVQPGNRGPIQDGLWINSPRILVKGSPQFQ